MNDAARTIPYAQLEYYSPERLGQYYYQIKAVREAQAHTVLEIGPGPGVVTHILRRAGLTVLTCDCEPSLAPDLLADVRDLPLAAGAVDFTLCCQVLEHLPFADFSVAMSEIKRVTRGQMLISLPYAARVVYSLHKWPGGRRSSWVLHFPWLPAPGQMAKNHYWEMGRREYPKKKIIQTLQAAQLSVVRAFTPADAPNNQFFLLA
ncbi:class I SAM-dependent methyltransferase [candidate division FCPU426 bacterium]|nr:class I SAM-dependent methyltransferase [candidate division FCPU426 bacterium]